MINHRQYLRDAMCEISRVFLIRAETTEEFEVRIGHRSTHAGGTAVLGIDGTEIQLWIAVRHFKRIVKYVGRHDAQWHPAEARRQGSSHLFAVIGGHSAGALI